MKKKNTSQRGNVLWFIMIAVVLTGLLTMALTRSSSNIDQTAEIEQMQIKIAEIMRYGRGLEGAIQELRFQGISENEISFENTDTVTDYSNSRCTDNYCRLFHVDGAGLSYRPPPKRSNDGTEWIFTGANNVGSTDNPVGTTASGTGNDLLMLLENADPTFCSVVNRQLEVNTTGDIPIDTGGIDTTPFTGSFSDDLDVIDGDPTPYELDNITAGCFIDANAGGVVYFYYVLLAR